MSARQSYNVGLLGFGNVNRAFVDHYLSVADNVLEDYGFELKFVAVCDSKGFIYSSSIDVRELINKKEKGLALDSGDVDPLSQMSGVIQDERIDVLIDGLPPSKMDEGPSFPLLVEALKRKITVICVNKAPLVFKGEELLNLAEEHDSKIGISGTTSASLPASGVLINELKGSEILDIRGIVNGTSNYVLDRVMFDGLSIYEAVKKAVKFGIAEPDYRFDLEGIDTCFKMVILGLLITGKNVQPRNIPCIGVLNLKQEEIESVVKEGKVIRLIGNLSINNNIPKISVGPEILNKEDPLFAVRGTGKGITFKTKYMGDLTMISSTSGRTHIAATILKDIINAIKY